MQLVGREQDESLLLALMQRSVPFGFLVSV
jgi:hypothetical protein